MPNPPKPTDLKVLQGTFRADRASVDEPKPANPLGPVPKGLDARAKKEWKDLQGWMGGRVVKDCDRAVAVLYCKAVSEEEWYDKQVQEKGAVTYTEKDYPVKNPLANLLKEAREMILKTAQQLGLTPSARTRISVPPVPKKSKMDEFKSRGKGRKR